MNVTQSNFPLLSGCIQDAIRTCSFAAIDCEFTGLVLPSDPHPLDTWAQRYEKLRAGISEYLVLELGLSLWKFRPESNSFQVKTYNIYVFPNGDERFSSQASCLKFLMGNGFDLNRCVREGISFLRPAEFDAEKSKLRYRQLVQLKTLFPNHSQDALKDILDGNTTLDKLRAQATPRNVVVQSEEHAWTYITSIWPIVESWMSSTKTELILPACNEYIRIGVYRHFEKIFFNKCFEMTSVRMENSNENRNLKKIKLIRSETSPVQRLLNRFESERKDLAEKFGLGEIIRTLSVSQKPIIGHNGIHDVLYLISQFLTPLPADYSEFSSLCQELFPNIFDTKYMTMSGTLKQYFKGSCLKDVYNQIKDQETLFPPLSLIQANEENYGNQSREHEAGYDAWLTGYIFAAFARMLLKKQTKFCLTDAALIPFANRINFVPSVYLTCFDLNRDSVEPVAPKDIFILEWQEPEEQEHANYILSLVEGYKRKSHGKSLIAFVPNSVQSCMKALRNQLHLIRPCRLLRATPARPVMPMSPSSQTHKKRQATSPSPTESTRPRRSSNQRDKSDFVWRSPSKGASTSGNSSSSPTHNPHQYQSPDYRARQSTRKSPSSSPNDSRGDPPSTTANNVFDLAGW